MSHKDKLFAFSSQEGFRVTEKSSCVILEEVPCLLEHQRVGHCTIKKSFDPANGVPTDAIGGAAHTVRLGLPPGVALCVYQANGQPFNPIATAPDGAPWVDISIRRGGPADPEDDPTVWHLLHRYAKQIIGAVKAHEREDRLPLTHDVLRIPNTFEERAGIRPMQEQVRNQSIALIGLGGTGSYILDLLAKTPVTTIHLCDDDEMDWHNFMRAPGAPTQDEIDSRHNSPTKKVDYYHNKYAALRDGICPHDMQVGNTADFTAFLEENSIDFAFVSIDQNQQENAQRQDDVYTALSQTRVPFIDSGISLALDHDQICGAVTTSFYEPGSIEWQLAIPNAQITGERLGYRNIQLPEANALAAALAVMEWRRRTGQYVKDTPSFLHKFRLEKARVRWTPGNDENP